MEQEKIRIDKYLWAIRLFKTRSMSAEACDKSKVKCQGSPVKASKTVKVGDEYEVKTEARKWVIRVTALLGNRVGFEDSLSYYADITPEEAKDISKFQPTSFHTGKRLSKIGRPTKKDRRDMDGFVEGDDLSE